MSRPESNVSFDATAAAEALDLFDAQNVSFRTSRIGNAVFGSAPRHRSVSNVKESPSRRDSPTLPWRPSSTEALARVPSAKNTSPPRPRAASAAQIKRPESPDIETILAKTPRPRRTSSSILSPSPSLRSRSQSTHSLRTSPEGEKHDVRDDESIISDYGTLMELDEENDSPSEYLDGSESDSSIDVHTPLPHLMFRDGLLSPRSKLLPQSLQASLTYPFADDAAEDRSMSVVSIASTVGSVVTKSGLQKDPRDTVRRRVRHRDGQLLRAGMGLTTGLGWSDSEDEDAPSALTRRLISTTIDRKRLLSAATKSRPTSEYSEKSFSRFASPVSVGKASLGRTISHGNMRSTSISFPTNSPTTSNVPKELNVQRNRAASQSNPIRNRAESVTSTTPNILSRDRAEFVASPTHSSVANRSRTPSSASTTQTSIPRSRTNSSASSSHTGLSRPRVDSSSSIIYPNIPKSFADFSASAISLVSTAASESANSSSSNYSSASTQTSVPRPLRLPQSSVLQGISRSFSQDASSSASPSASVSPVDSFTYPQRKRTLSGPRPHPQQLRTPSKSITSLSSTASTNESQIPSHSYSISEQRTSPPRAATHPPPSSQILTFTSPPPGTSSSPPARQRPTLIGARPRPRTGTGMAYRTSSLSNLQDTAARMRSMSLASSTGSLGTAPGSSGLPIRI